MKENQSDSDGGWSLVFKGNTLGDSRDQGMCIYNLSPSGVQEKHILSCILSMTLHFTRVFNDKCLQDGRFQYLNVVPFVLWVSHFNPVLLTVSVIGFLSSFTCPRLFVPASHSFTSLRLFALLDNFAISFSLYCMCVSVYICVCRL